MILLNGFEVNATTFPNKEIYVGETLSLYVKTTKTSVQNITLRFENNEDFILLQFVNEWLMEEGYLNRELYIPYMPYSRMDRKVSQHLFSLKYIAKMINNMDFQRVYVLEAHSDVTLREIKNSVPISYVKELIELAMLDMGFDKELDVVVFPDAGAKKRYEDMVIEGISFLEGEKVRDFDSGDILSLTLSGVTERKYRKALIVDDLCSRGGTFIQISQRCREIGIDDISLAVTHLEENVYTGDIFKTVRKVYSTDALEPFLKRIHEFPQIQVFKLPTHFNMTLTHSQGEIL